MPWMTTNDIDNYKIKGTPFDLIVINVPYKIKGAPSPPSQRFHSESFCDQPHFRVAGHLKIRGIFSTSVLKILRESIRRHMHQMNLNTIKSKARHCWSPGVPNLTPLQSTYRYITNAFWLIWKFNASWIGPHFWHRRYEKRLCHKPLCGTETIKSDGLKAVFFRKSYVHGMTQKLPWTLRGQR